MPSRLQRPLQDFILDATLASKIPSRPYFEAENIVLPSLIRFINQLQEGGEEESLPPGADFGLRWGEGKGEGKHQTPSDRRMTGSA